jgi:hypothetical protein
MPIVTGVIAEMPMVALRTMMERTAQRRGAASHQALQHLALAGGHGGSELGQIGWSPSAQYLVNG